MPQLTDIASKVESLTDDIEQQAEHEEKRISPVSEASETSTRGREKPRQKFKKLRRIRIDVLGLRSRLYEERRALKYETESLENQEAAMLLNVKATIQSEDIARRGCAQPSRMGDEEVRVAVVPGKRQCGHQ
jgi:hypothetical protein